MSRPNCYIREKGGKVKFRKEKFMEDMITEGVEKLTLHECRPVKKSKLIYCRIYQGEFEKCDCGQSCEQYMPGNGVSGVCIHRLFIYRPFRKVQLTRSGKISILK
ncbi:MAG: hypothetical protein A2W93_14430 [Bacteroidetes bacterium GWF2_43_63]|nr:MAG: hypothetical protein A2W94_01000 [Bacteroidetes bacterium GWE2_42_42]OFY52537.1 MAG: hypothetical protein A2W93_14430 [Bacteroidetes bacterium GWF2_43_63]HBG71445.1 hypothetical protein [Bacteroidales bacterium]HCB60803.1 hypothetical protein [Bacteroidales bacterium]HCY23472.1 hypothetical protein [Bacteroidales bacterium]